MRFRFSGIVFFIGTIAGIILFDVQSLPYNNNELLVDDQPRDDDPLPL